MIHPAHRLFVLTFATKIIGPKATTFPQAGLDTTTRVGPLAQLIVKTIVEDDTMDPFARLFYNPTRWRNATHEKFSSKTDWLKPVTEVKINGNDDAFSQRIGQECQPFDGVSPPAEGLFEAKNVVIISNGRLIKCTKNY